MNNTSDTEKLTFSTLDRPCRSFKSTTHNTVSPRRYAAFVKVNTATFTPSLLTSYDTVTPKLALRTDHEMEDALFLGFRLKISTASLHPVNPPASRSLPESTSRLLEGSESGTEASKRFAYSRIVSTEPGFVAAAGHQPNCFTGSTRRGAHTQEGRV